MKDLLPNKLSKLLILSLKDLDYTISSGKADINMGTWLTKYQNGTCEVCHAGAVLLNRYDLKKEHSLYYRGLRSTVTENFSTSLLTQSKDYHTHKLVKKLEFINEIRSGSPIEEATEDYIEFCRSKNSKKAFSKLRKNLSMIKGIVRLKNNEDEVDFTSDEIQHNADARNIYYTYIMLVATVLEDVGL